MPKDPAAADAPTEQTISERKEQYLIAQKPSELLPQGVAPIDVNALEQQLKDHPEIEFIRTIKPQGFVSLMAADSPAGQSVMVAAMPAPHAEALGQLPQLV